MPRPRRWPGLLLVLLWLGPAPLTDAQTEEEQARAELEQLQRKIEQVDRELGSARSEHSGLQQQLREIEVALGELQRAISANLAAITAAETELDQLEERQRTQQQARDSQQARIATELRAAWQMGQQGQLKVLLNQENPHTVARAMAYYRYFFEARNALVAQYRATLEELAQIQQQIQVTVNTLETERAELDQRREQVLTSQQQRQAVLASLASTIQSKDDELQRLQQDRAELEQLLEAIEQAVVDLQLPEDYRPFASARGSLAWPVEGKPDNRFGAARGAGGMRWQGINITASEGSTVRAIHHGRVVYADWLRGSGLLLILDHGEGYMSLYAHNQSLLREVGEWVAPGTPLGTVGSSGGLDESALYFEIRKQGKPLDPAAWCR